MIFKRKIYNQILDWKNKSDGKTALIDFLVTKKNKICPIEVKSSGYSKHPSIDEFSIKYSSRISDQYLIYTKDYQKDGNIVMLPIYMTQFL